MLIVKYTVTEIKNFFDGLKIKPYNQGKKVSELKSYVSRNYPNINTN